MKSGAGGVLTRFRIVALILVFSVGSVAVIASVARLGALAVFQNSKDPSCEFETPPALFQLPPPHSPLTSSKTTGYSSYYGHRSVQPFPHRPPFEFPPS